MNAPDKIKKLTETFDYNLETYKKGSYNETQVRREFIDPFFEALGWDIANKKGYAEAYKDVIHEDAIKVGGVTKAPDYCFRVGGARKFFLEAKKPAVNIKEDIHPAFQLRRYGWSAKLPLSILTDFEEFAVYDCRVRPVKTDMASHSRIFYLKYTDYVDRWEEIESVFSREAILKGSFDKYAASKKNKRGTALVDTAFLQEIERWRELLARNIALRNKTLSQRELNFAIQQTIDRIIFLRICEDRGIENYGRLMALRNGENVYKRLFQLFRKADDKYNSGLFHFKKEKKRENFDNLTPVLSIDDKVLKDIFKNLYYPDSPYEFSVLPADILGQVYEKFLGKVIRLTPKHQAKIEEKPEVRKAGGVYYTPTYIVDYIVKQTVGKLVKGKKAGPRGAVSRLKILDPACGSGSFLIGAYQFLLDWHLDQYVNDNPEKLTKGKTPRLYHTDKGEWRLTAEERKRILLNNIYGVDIDPQAVEVTKLSLLLKVLEGEDEQSIGKQMALFQERVLPDLSNNIKCGNSLIGPDFYEKQQMNIFDEEEIYRVNAFDWNAEFADIMGKGGFDAVIGNPPWGSLITISEKEYLHKNFSNKKGEAESHLYFIEKAFMLINLNGIFGYITPNTWLTVLNSEQIRKYLLKNAVLREIVQLSKYIFKGAPDIVPILIFILKNKTVNSCRIKKSNLIKIDDYNFHNAFYCDDIKQSVWENTEKYIINIYLTLQTLDIVNKCKINSAPLGDVCKVLYGIKTGNNKKFLSDRKTDKFSCKALKTGEIKRYSLIWKGLYLWWDKTLAGYRNTPLNTPKIVIQYIRKLSLKRRIITALDKNGEYYPLNNYSYVTIDNENISIYYVLGLLNSNVINYYFSCTFIDYNIKPTYLKQIPIRKIDFSNNHDMLAYNQVIELVKKLNDFNNKANEKQLPQSQILIQRQIEATDKQIDQLVYKLYDLTDEEIKIVESET